MYPKVKKPWVKMKGQKNPSCLPSVEKNINEERLANKLTLSPRRYSKVPNLTGIQDIGKPENIHEAPILAELAQLPEQSLLKKTWKKL